jgi:hypothetical protein
MALSSLPVDVLLCIMKFLDPQDRFELVISGALPGFELLPQRFGITE